MAGIGDTRLGDVNIIQYSHTSTHARAARARTTPSDERYDVRSAGVADWKTAAWGNTERTLTA